MMLLLIGMFSVRIQEKKCGLKTYFECEAWKIPEQISCSIFLSDSPLGSEMRESLGSGHYAGTHSISNHCRESGESRW